jgi:hypothetical protein
VLPNVFDAARVLTDQPPAHLVQRSLDGERAPLECRFAEPADALVGVHPDNQPPWTEVQGFDSGDAHAEGDFCWRRAGVNAREGFP